MDLSLIWLVGEVNKLVEQIMCWREFERKQCKTAFLLLMRKRVKARSQKEKEKCVKQHTPKCDLHALTIPRIHKFEVLQKQFIFI
jgi:hypothetical protein